MGLLEKCLDFLPTRRAVSDIEEEREDRYPARNEEDQSVKGLSTETISQLVIPKVLKGREDKIVTVIQHALSQINPYYDTKIREVNHVEYR